MPTAAPMMPPSAIGASKHALAAVLGLQPLGAAEDAAEVADVLAEHDDVVVALHHHVHGRADGHVHRSSRSSLFLHLPALPLQVCGHVLEHVLEDAPGAGHPPVEQRAVAARPPSPRPITSRSTSATSSSCCSSDHSPRAMRWFFSRSIGSPSGHDFHSSAGRYRDGSSEVECAAARYVTHSISVGPRLAAGAFGCPPRGGEHREVVVAVDAQCRDAVADGARRERRLRAAGDALERRDRPLVVDDVEDHRRLVCGGERERVVEVGLGGRAFADDARTQCACRP